MNFTAKALNTTAKVTNSTVNGMNSIAKACNTSPQEAVPSQKLYSLGCLLTRKILLKNLSAITVNFQTNTQ